MKPTHLGMAVGGFLAVVWIAFGFWAFFFAAIAISVGAGVGRIIEGRLDLRSLADALRGRRTS